MPINPTKNYLLEAIIGIFADQKKGRVLDLGCGKGEYSLKLKQMGYQVVAADAYADFKYKDEIEFRQCDANQKLPFEDNSFNYVLLAEIIEHLKNPYEFMSDITRILKPSGALILSTPNILNMKSRMRFLFESSYEYFREPPLEQIKNLKDNAFQLHVIPYRYHELEYLLYDSGMNVEKVYTSILEGKGLSFLKPLIRYQLLSKEKRSLKKGGLDYSRINKVLLSDEILFGRHLIVKAVKR
jgi:SAM-dependent methyltransferase